MKPSLKIQEIYHNLVKDEKDINYISNALPRAILQYFDEEWEKNKPCEHKICPNCKGKDMCVCV